MIRKNQVAPKITTGLVSSTSSLLIESGNSIWVYGIIFSHDNATGTSSDISMKTGDGTTTLMVIDIRNPTFVLDIPFKADKGILFTTPDVTAKRVSVFYMGPGI